MPKAILVEDAVLRDTFWNAAIDLKKENDALKQRINHLENSIQTAWGIIANVSGGDWSEHGSDWREAAIRWRDEEFHPLMKLIAVRKSKEAKP